MNFKLFCFTVFKISDRIFKYSFFIFQTNTQTELSLPYTAQVFDAVNGIALALSDLISRKTVSHRTNALTVRAYLFNKLESYNSESNGYISALGTNKRMYFDSNKDGPSLLDIVNLVPNPPRWKHVAEFSVLKEGAGKEVLLYLKNPLFPGGHIVPVIGAGKVVYKIAAFFPKDDRLGALSDLGKYWVCFYIILLLLFYI